jgi:F-type H+-transporting ATPase subunit beta
MTATLSDNETAESTGGIGRVSRVIGPVVDVEFSVDEMPEMYNALHVDISLGDIQRTLTLEVEQHIGDGLVRSVSMQPTDGLVRGARVTDTGRGISVPVGDVTKGHVFNTIGECLNLEPDERLEVKERWPIHRSAPAFDQLESKTEMFHTGIKVIDLLTPVRARRQDRPVRRSRRRQDRADPGDDRPGRARPRRRVGVRRRRRAHP